MDIFLVLLIGATNYNIISLINNDLASITSLSAN